MAGFLKSLGAAGEAYKMLQAIDQDGLGISEDDFVAFAQRIGLGEAGEQAARTAFEQVDTNGNGKIDLKEAYNAYEKITQLLNMSKNQ